MRRSSSVLILAALISTLVFLGAPPAPQPTAAQAPGFDFVFIIDTSGSMEGKPPGSGNLNIFPRLKEVLVEFLASVEAGATVFVYTFHAGVQSERKFEIRGRDDVNRLKEYVNDLRADGAHTWIFRSLRDIIERLSSRKDRRPTIIYLYTDGLDNDPTRQYTMADIMKLYSLKRGEQDFLYYATLGVRLPDDQRNVAKNTPRVTVVENPKGTIAPPLFIEAKLPVLVYGNLFKTGEDIREQLFVIHGKAELPPDVRLRAEPVFPRLIAMGVGATVAPSAFPPSERVSLKLSLINRNSFKEDAFGDVEGGFKMSVESGEPSVLVLIAPDEIRVMFTYEPERVVTIAPAEGKRWPIDFGTLQPGSAAEVKVRLSYNAQAQRRGGTLRVSVGPAEKNPRPLTPDRHWTINGQKAVEVPVRVPDVAEVTLAVTLADLPPGMYRGELRFASRDFTIQGEGLATTQTDPPQRFVPWAFVIPSPPAPPWVKVGYGLIGLLVLALIGFLVASLVIGEAPGRLMKRIATSRRPPAIPQGTALEIREPRESRGTQAGLSGMQKVRMGRDTQYFADADVLFEIRAGRDEGKDVVAITVESGDVWLRVPGERDARSVVEEKLFDGDILSFGKYQVQFTSSSLIRD